MKIALLGYGRMGKYIEGLAVGDGHEIVLKINLENKNELTAENIQKADVAIEFSFPDAAFHNISFCLNNGVPVISGTTGWIDQLSEIESICKKNNGAFFYASNFSVGVNLFFALNKKLAQMMNSLPEYNAEILEIHHTKKLDAPSGTAITLAEGMIANLDSKTKWEKENATEDSGLAIKSQRIPDVPGTHTITYGSEIDKIEISHVAHSREGFARGAILAATWIIGKKGIYGMEDLLGY